MYCRNCGNEMHEAAVVCVKCGVPAGKGKRYCPNCGAATHEEAVFCVSCGAALQESKPARTYNIEPRNLVTAIVLSIVTCGIYSIFWFIKLTDELNEITGNEKDMSGGMCFLLNLLTCGIYGYYWAYKMGEKQDSLDDKRSNTAILYLLLSIFGFSIVVQALIQDTINKQIGAE